jgi:5,10-methylene-tetrahydrofolate dehydrogenase/methenyl tetrahydrofolate cyclohydrolase
VATVLVCADPASQVYGHRKGKLAAELGVANFGHRLSEQASKAKLLVLIAKRAIPLATSKPAIALLL